MCFFKQLISHLFSHLPPKKQQDFRFPTKDGGKNTKRKPLQCFTLPETNISHPKQGTFESMIFPFGPFRWDSCDRSPTSPMIPRHAALRDMEQLHRRVHLMDFSSPFGAELKELLLKGQKELHQGTDSLKRTIEYPK